MKLALVVLLALALVAGILFVVKPWNDGIELTYALQFPAGYAGDRKGAAEETLNTLQKRLAGVDARWTGRAFANGRIQLRFQGLKDVSSVRRVIEKPARLGIYRMAPGEQSKRFWADRTPILEARDFEAAERVHDRQRGGWGVMLDMSFPTSRKADAVEDALLGLVLDGEFFGVPDHRLNAGGDSLIFWGAPSETAAEEWAMSIQGGALLFPLGEPDVGRFR